MCTMRHAVAGLTTVVAAGLLLGCADAARGPTGPEQFAGSPVLGVSAKSASVIKTNDRIPFILGVFVSCANGGAGESVIVEGTLHFTTHQTISNSGNVHISVHSQPQGAKGVGQTTGDSYNGNGVTQEHINVNGTFPVTDTFVNNFLMIGQGPGNNFTVHQLVHITFNANGVLTAFTDNETVECK